MQQNHRTVGSSAQMCSYPFREHIAFHRHLVWLLSYTHKSARPLSQHKSLKPSDAYISQWVKPPSVQTMACLAISLTDVNLLFIRAKEIYFYEIIFEIQTKIYLKKSSAKCRSFRPGINESGWALWITCELSRTFRWVIRVSSSLSCTCIFWFQDIYFQGIFYWHGLTLIPALISNYMHYKVWDQITYLIQCPN